MSSRSSQSKSSREPHDPGPSGELVIELVDVRVSLVLGRGERGGKTLECSLS
jgi:hypothetical protein